MKLENPMLVVTDIDKSVAFYKKVFGLMSLWILEQTKTLTGGLALRTVETYREFIGTSEISFGGNNFEILLWKKMIFDAFAKQTEQNVILNMFIL